MKERKTSPRRFPSATAYIGGDPSWFAIRMAMRDGDIWYLLDLLRAEDCPRGAREFAADVIEGKAILPERRPMLLDTCLMQFAIATRVAELKNLGTKPDPAVKQAMAEFKCSKSAVYAALNWWADITSK